MRDPHKLLVGVHPQLASVITVAGREFENQTEMEITIASGFRTAKEQHDLYIQGKSRTTNSAHMQGNAVDIGILERVDGKWRYCDKLPWYKAFNRLVQKAADEFDITVGWGGDWKYFRDGPHFFIFDTPFRKEEKALMLEAKGVEPSPAKDRGVRVAKPIGLDVNDL